MKKLIIFLMISICTAGIQAQDMEISQIDTGSLLFRGEINIYFTLPGEQHRDLSAENFSVTEETAGPLEITEFLEEPNKSAGVDFILLVDNSGSMYEESYNGGRRIDHARTALEGFLDQIEESEDRAAVYAFNTELLEIAPFGTSIPDIRRSISSIRQPDAAGSYTELYNSLAELPALFPKSPGRKALIVLSDGENYPVFEHQGNASGRWGETLTAPEDIIKTGNENGITIDGINISDKMDISLEQICRETGGKFHDVRSAAGISGVYYKIRNRISNEYMISVKTPPLQNSRGRIILSFGDQIDSRMLPSPDLFGRSADRSVLTDLLLLLAGAAMMTALYFLQFEKPVKNAQIRGLGSGRRTVLSSSATIIGAGRNADFTLAGQPGIDAEHATIVQDEKTGSYTIISSKAVRVNNRSVKTKTLTPGDVIRIEGSTIIFDAPDITV